MEISRLEDGGQNWTGNTLVDGSQDWTGNTLVDRGRCWIGNTLAYGDLKTTRLSGLGTIW